MAFTSCAGNDEAVCASNDAIKVDQCGYAPNEVKRAYYIMLKESDVACDEAAAVADSSPVQSGETKAAEQPKEVKPATERWLREEF